MWGVDQATKVDTAAFTRLELGQGAELLYRVAGGGQQTSDLQAMFDNIKNEETVSRIIMNQITCCGRFSDKIPHIWQRQLV